MFDGVTSLSLCNKAAIHAAFSASVPSSVWGSSSGPGADGSWGGLNSYHCSEPPPMTGLYAGLGLGIAAGLCMWHDRR